LIEITLTTKTTSADNFIVVYHHTMPSFFSPPSSPTFGFFPTGATSPNAFVGFHQNPRDTYTMYSTFSSGTSQGAGSKGSTQGGKSMLKRLMWLL